MRKAIALLALTLGVALLVGCASTDQMRLDLTPRPATSPSHVRVFVDEPDEPYTTIAVVKLKFHE
jgi:hypothetical protein